MAKNILDHTDFTKIYEMIHQSRIKALHQVNQTLVELYWNIGKYLSTKTQDEKAGKAVVDELSRFIRSKEPSSSGFSARNLWRMKKFYETYHGDVKLSTLLTEISWSNHLHILSKTKSHEEKLFYLELAAKNHYSARDFSRIIDSGTFERTTLADKKLSTVLTEFPAKTSGIFKDLYIFEFIGISDGYHENDLRKALLRNLSQFLLELGPDFSFIAEEYVVQVGMKDYRIDLLMHNRSTNSMVAIELKVTEFQPEYLGKLQFYLEALDRDIKKPHENPSIGILICKTKDDEVVKYALSRNVSPAMIAEYETKLIDKKILQNKIHEITEIISIPHDTNNIIDKE